MKSQKTILANIKNQLNLTNDDARHQFYLDAKSYIKAIKECRVICNIQHVSKSGMTRFLTFKYLEKSKYEKSKYFLNNTFFLFKSLGYSYVKNHDSFRISGCGMDMVFNTNYCIVHDLYRLGFITKQQCETLSQKTPFVI